MKNYYLSTISTNPWNNLALEKVVADRVREGDLIFYLWQNDRTVVVGRNQNALRECRAQLLEEEGGFLARRSTGGGAVYHDLGNVCFTFAASPERYDLRRQMKVVMSACAAFGIRTELSGRNDVITEDGFKFSGNAFSVTGKCKLQHGTIMVDVNREQLHRYLTPSPLKLKAKGIASVQSRVCNLKELNPSVETEKIKAALCAAFAEEYGVYETLREEDFAPERDEAYRVFSSWEWRYGKTPACEVEYAGLLSWGEVQVMMELKGMRIVSARVYSDTLETELPRQLEKLLNGRKYDLTDLPDDLSVPVPDAGQREKLLEAVEWLKNEWRTSLE